MRWVTETVRALRGPQRGWRGARPCCVRGGSWPERSRRSWHRDRQSLDPYSGSDPSEPLLELNESDIEHLMVDPPKGPRNNEAVITQDRLGEVDPGFKEVRPVEIVDCNLP